MFQLDLKSNLSIYEQIVENFKRLIVAGIIKPEEKLPSVRELSKLLTVNPNTVQKAYRELESQGYIRTSSGLGTFACVPSKSEINPKHLEEIEREIGKKVDELYFMGFDFQYISELLEKIIKERNGKHDKN